MNNIWIGIDDTDSTKGGCTTFLALALIKAFVENNLDIIGFPRLVRLNPNIPWKTRGNGAISLQIGRGTGKKTRIGEIGDQDLFCYNDMDNDNLEYDEIANIIEEKINEYARLDDENTNSGFVLLKKQPPLRTYENTVRDIIQLKETKNYLEKTEAFFKGYKNSRGLIGATASVAWEPNGNNTYELISYREKKRWGTKRNVDDISTKMMDKKFPSTFDNYDYKNKHNRLVPSSPCPVLFGIRGDNFEDLAKAKDIIKSEKNFGWLIFLSNQGTDDHLEKTTIDKIKPYQSVIVQGKINKIPYTIKGGHVIFTIKGPKGKIDCAAYEPTKEFRDIIRGLTIDDKVEVYGGVREKPLTINLEKIKINHLVKKIEKVENPICPKCGKHMKSKGKNQGFKCKICGTKEEKPRLREEKRPLNLGLYEVPVCARRHLSKPLKRVEE